MQITSVMSPRVLAVARLVRRFSHDELAHLVELVPALTEAQHQADAELLTHFRQLGIEQRGGQSAQPTDPFIGGLTYAQYFALSEAEQDAIWEQLFVEASLAEESMSELDIIPHDNLPAG